MTTSPEEGWYNDPGDAKRHRYWDGKAWTDKTRVASGGAGSDLAPGEPTKKRRPWLSPVSIIAGTITAVGAFALTVAILPDHDSNPTPHSTPTATTPIDPGEVEPITELTPWDVDIPSDWATFSSRSGAIAYSYDPAWDDISAIISEQALADSPGLESTETEIAGAWMMSGSALSGGTSLTVIALSDGTVPLFLPIQTEQFASSNATASGGSDYTVLVDAGFTTAQGYEAWRIDYTMEVYGVTANETVIGFISDVTLGFVFVSSIDDFDEWMPDLQRIIDTLVVIKPPVGPA